MNYLHQSFLLFQDNTFQQIIQQNLTIIMGERAVLSINYSPETFIIK